MTVRELGELTWEEVRGLDRARTVALLPCGALEAHGPHLPLATDVVIAEAMARECASRLETAGVAAVLLPPLVFTAAPFAAEFEGTVSIAPATVTALILDLARELTRQGFAAARRSRMRTSIRRIAPRWPRPAARARSERLLKLVCPDLTRKPWATRLSEEFRSGACHAGRFEGSIVMAARPDLVREDIRARARAEPRIALERHQGRRAHVCRGGRPARVLRLAGGRQRRGGPAQRRGARRHPRRGGSERARQRAIEVTPRARRAAAP